MKVYSDLRKAILGGWQFTLDYGRLVDQKHWQGTKAPRRTLEAIDFIFRAPMPDSGLEARELIRPNLPWAEEHFLERVSGKPMNPPPSHERWPFAQKNNNTFRKDEKFDHTYPERFWPKFANSSSKRNMGIRWEYGDYHDLLIKLEDDLTTRQAFLPIWFPEDTGQRPDIRVPCTLGYHFMVRDGRLDIKYFMRSTDMLRHYQDDIYLCYRLAEYTLNFLLRNHTGLHLGFMTFITFSAHIFEGEEKTLEKKCVELSKL